MQTTTLYRLSGASLLVGGLVAIYAHLTHPAPPQDLAGVAAFLRTTPTAHLVAFAGILLVLMGLPGWYSRCAASGGVAALLGFVFLFVGVVFSDFIHCPVEFSATIAMQSLPVEQAGEFWMKTFYATPLAAINFIGQPLVFLGALFFLLGTRRMAHLPRYAGLFLWGFLLFFAGNYLPLLSNYAGKLFTLSFYLAFVIYGVWLLTEKGERAHAA